MNANEIESVVALDAAMYALREALRMIDTQVAHLQSDRRWLVEQLEHAIQLRDFGSTTPARNEP